ncbi:fumarylacetoacetate hydrolase family protein [Lutispora sp.]|uniref:fumarylacetoacetate hydrolase family protein n=1 Tax=Lutispora sp. TaxID=2828727 RepID=UPI002B1EDCB1|nr:fumarylacetoacetate hydrolase family protein [Lutispora sp.]MEA4960184.1 fumarylacetoacetate hydrolase family protein [Lutispora sp.]
MKFIRFKKDDFISYGLLEGEKVKIIQGDIFGDYEITDSFYDITEIDFLTPCMPSKIVCVGLNYRSHAQEMKLDLPKEPVIFIKPSTSILAHRGEIIRPEMSQRVDYEAELALVMGRQAKNIKPDEAVDYILGATCFNDVTARDLQQRDGQWTRAKSFDTFAPFGPCIATDLDYDNLPLELILNGETKQKSNTSDFIFSVGEMVSFISNVMLLNPGDVIATGTPSGIGPLNAGDIVQVKIQDVGILKNYVR